MTEAKVAVTIRKVAEEAGVSIGTVDRILHHRGRVSKETTTRVLEIIDKLGYKPNIHASLLSIRKVFKIAVIIPYFQSGEFWSLIYDGIRRAEEEMMSYNPEVSILYYNQFDGDSFQKACTQCIAMKPDGVILSPLHRELSSRFVSRMAADKIPVVFLDTCVEDCDYFAYYGVDLYDSARVLADLVFSQSGKIGALVKFNIKSENGFYSEAFLRRDKGFAQFLEEKRISCKVYDCKISPNDFLKNVSVFDEFFNAHPEVHHAITMTSRAHLLSDWMEIRGHRNLSIYGYDITQANLRALEKGNIRFLIAQHTDVQAYTATRALIEYLTIGKPVAKRDNLFPIDILTKYNVGYYL